MLHLMLILLRLSYFISSALICWHDGAAFLPIFAAASGRVLRIYRLGHYFTSKWRRYFQPMINRPHATSQRYNSFIYEKLAFAKFPDKRSYASRAISRFEK